MEATDRYFLYVTDPMCSWCWGFSPVITALKERFNLPVKVVAGGLSVGPAARRMSRKMAQTIADHWHHVHDASGQPFDHAILDRDDWVYDTELPNRALVAAREQDPDAALVILERLHAAFYRDNIDITQLEPYAGIAGGMVPDVERFLADLTDDANKKATWEDFTFARQMGISGFPTLLLSDDDQLALITRGYAPLDTLAEPIAAWLKQRDAQKQPALAQGAACDLDGNC
ncbi:MAG: DsbA family protein [Myxococcota bacterium]